MNNLVFFMISGSLSVGVVQSNSVAIGSRSPPLQRQPHRSSGAYSINGKGRDVADAFGLCT